MTPDTKKKLALAALICLAPGGFVLGATLAANHYRKKAAMRGPSGEEPDEAATEDRK